MATSPPTGQDPPQRLGRRLLIRALRFLILIVGGFILGLYFMQDRLIFPGRATQGAVDAVLKPQPGIEVLELKTAHGETVAAVFGAALLPDNSPHPDPASRPALLYFYGNAMCMAYAEPELERFRRLGLNVLIPDYLGYGMSGGKASEIGCRQTSEAAYQELHRRGFPDSRIIVAGWSLGGAVAIDLAYRRPLGGLIAFSTFTSIQEMARQIVPLPLPRLLFAHRFDSIGKMPSITCPVLSGHGRRDTLAPFPMQARLVQAARSPVTTLVIDNAEHNDFFDVGGNRIDDAIRAFVKQHVSSD